MLYLKRLEIENVRCFGKKQVIDFTSEGKISQWTVILGDNGTGKTSVLRSIVALLPTPEFIFYRKNNPEEKYSSEEMNTKFSWGLMWDVKHKNGELPSEIVLVASESETPFLDGNGFQTEIFWRRDHKNSDKKNILEKSLRFINYGPREVYCFSYGANRKMSTRSLSDESLGRTSQTLFNEDALLQNSAEYFLRLDYETAKSKKGNSEKNKVKELLLRILPSGIQDIRVVKTGRLQRNVEVETPYGWVGINELSLGYKTTIAWLMDFATKMIYFHEKSENPFHEPAILLIDEIDLHMHPAWQREIIENLTELFPKTQFIVTAHSPLIVQAALDSNLVLLRRKGDHIKVENTPEIIKSWRIDQILTSDLFGLKTSRSTEAEKHIKRRRKLLKMKDSLSEAQSKELEKLNKEIDEMPIGETKAEIDAMDILRDFAQKVEAGKKAKPE